MDIEDGQIGGSDAPVNAADAGMWIGVLQALRRVDRLEASALLKMQELKIVRLERRLEELEKRRRRS
jgi:hypothetical protein